MALSVADMRQYKFYSDFIVKFNIKAMCGEGEHCIQFRAAELRILVFEDCSHPSAYFQGLSIEQTFYPLHLCPVFCVLIAVAASLVVCLKQASIWPAPLSKADAHTQTLMCGRDPRAHGKIRVSHTLLINENPRYRCLRGGLLFFSQHPYVIDLQPVVL